MKDAIRLLQGIKSDPSERLAQTIKADLDMLSAEAQRERNDRLAREEAAREEARKRALREAQEGKEKALREAQQRKEREEAELARRKQIEAEALAQKKAQEMYGEYRKSAEAVADYILRFLSATESSLTLEDHRHKLQELVYAYNKFDSPRTPLERKRESYAALTRAVAEFKRAQAAWDLKAEVSADVKGAILLSAETTRLLSELSKDLDENTLALVKQWKFLIKFMYDMDHAPTGSEDSLRVVLGFTENLDANIRDASREKELLSKFVKERGKAKTQTEATLADLGLLVGIESISSGLWKKLKRCLLVDLDAALQTAWRSARKSYGEAMARLGEGK
jgi:hypothetical protein